VAISLLDQRTRLLKSSASWPAFVAVGALAVIVGFTAATVSPARADGGSGGSGDGGCLGGAGGTGIAGNGGGLGGACNSGGGGGAAGGGFGGPNIGPFGGSGGNGGNHGTVAPTLNNASPLSGQDGGNGTDGVSVPANAGGGGGGGAGGAGAVVTGITGNNSSAVTGGRGGNGGNGTNGGIGGGGGGGGDGGAALIFTGTATLSNALGGNLSAGRGGNGGAGSGAGPGGNGGAGGIGVQFFSGGALTNAGAIFGGNGGAAGSNGTPTTGAGGAGVVGGDLSIVNSGTIQGGLSGNGATRANAISFTSGTNVLELQAGSNIVGNVVAFSNADILRFGGSNNAAFDASLIGSQYQGFGAFDKIGTSTWTLSGTNNAATPWTVDAGTLQVNATMAAAPVTVNNGATLAGTGTIGSLTVKNGGVFVPGSVGSSGTMTIAGNLAFQSGALYLVQFSTAGGSRANVGGTATLAGTMQISFLSSSASFSKSNVVLSATGGVNGTFNQVQFSNLPTGLTASVVYTPTTVLLNFDGSISLSGLAANQQQVASAINAGFANGASLPFGFANLFGLSGPNLSAALQMIDGETATGAQQTTFQAMNQFMGVMTDPFTAGRGEPLSAGGSPTGYAEESLAYAGKRKPDDALAAIYTKAPPVRTFEQRWSVWAAGYGGSQTTSGDPRVLGSNDARSSIAGTAVGADYRISPNTLAGFALAGGGTNFSVNNLGSGRSDLFQAGAFVRHTAGAAYLTGALAYGWQDITTNRTVTIAGVDQLRAQFNANAWSGRVEGGYRFVSQGFGWTPYAAGQFTTFELPAYAEQAIVGANTFALAYNAKSVTDTRSELGLRGDKSFAAADGVFTLRGRLAWAHDYNPDRAVGATFQALPGASFVVNGARQASDSALVTASAEKKWLNGWSTAATFEGEFSNVTTSYAGKGVVRYAW
jgi:uncharacterized protein with beta-barrel porin domain